MFRTYSDELMKSDVLTNPPMKIWQETDQLLMSLIRVRIRLSLCSELIIRKHLWNFGPDAEFKFEGQSGLLVLLFSTVTDLGLRFFIFLDVHI